MQRTDLNLIEARLQETLIPVQVRAEFVRDLKERLLVKPDISLEAHKTGLMRSVVLTSAGILSGGVLLVVGIKTFVSLSKKMNVVSQMQKAGEAAKPSPLPTAL